MNNTEKNAKGKILQRSKLKLIEVLRALVLLDCTDDSEYMELMLTLRQSVGSISILEMDYREKDNK